MPENFGVEEAGIPALISGTAEPKDAASSLAARHRRAHGRWKQLDSLELNNWVGGLGHPAPSHTTGHAGPHPAVRQNNRRRFQHCSNPCSRSFSQYWLSIAIVRGWDADSRQDPFPLPAAFVARFRLRPKARRFRKRALGRFHSFHLTCRRRRLSHWSSSLNTLGDWMRLK